MNFDHMPELHWLLGYPFALTLMVARRRALPAVQAPQLDLARPTGRGATAPGSHEQQLMRFTAS